MINIIQIAWDVMLYGPNGREQARSETYRWLCSILLGRLALWSIYFGVGLATSGNLTLLGLWLRRDKLLPSA